MPLLDLDLPDLAADVPGEIRAFLREADRRVRQFQRRHHLPGFEPSDFEGVYRALRALAEGGAPGGLFCEWGSGFGVAACLAALLDFDACGIEAEGALVAAARRLAADFDLPVEFAHGSFLPRASRDAADGDFAWFNTEAGDGHEALGLAPEDFSVIYAYPWPDEEGLTEAVFERHAGPGAVLLTYHGGDDFRLRRKATGLNE